MQELSLRFFGGAIRHRWRWIVLFVVLAVGLTVAISLLRPPSYQTEMEILVHAPKYQWRFNAGIVPITDNRDWRREYMLLGQTNQVARSVAERLGLSDEPERLLRRVTFRSDSTDRIIFEATGQSFEAATALANAWTEVLQEAILKRFGPGPELPYYAQLHTKFDAQLNEALSRLEAFKAETGQGVGYGQYLEAGGLEPTQKELDRKAGLLSDYRVAQSNLERLAQELTEVSIGQRAASAVPWELLGNPLLFQRPALQPDRLPSRTDVSAWLTLLAGERSALMELEDWLNGDVLKLQATLAKEDSELFRLTRERNLVAESYDATVRRLNEIELQQIVDTIGIEILETKIPSSPTTWSLPVSLAVAAVGALIIALWLVLFLEYRSVTKSAAVGASNT